ncbi:hypothetical protein V7x_46480 [Crateriforma conspicua]|uniref:Uncharacterized protein n=2 Tax=Crateriforma conspicua TaxID=2527996 RepID=A0A5C6FRZ3_9PLAN|nr:hypothetical protein V7x_46480 [Crateriforma conspicua]
MVAKQRRLAKTADSFVPTGAGATRVVQVARIPAMHPPKRPDANPYTPTAEIPEQAVGGPIHLPPDVRGTFVHQVPILGILMVVQGGLDVLMSAAVGVYAFILPEAISQSRPGGGGNPPLPPEATWVATALIATVSFFVLAIGIANIFAGIWTVQFRHRGRALLAVSFGLLSGLTCYCLPTSLLLFIYALVVLNNRGVVLAFDLRRRGHHPQAIQQAFSRGATPAGQVPPNASATPGE